MIIDTLIQVLNYIFAACMPVTHIGGYAVSLLSVLFIWKYWGKISEERSMNIRCAVILCLLVLLSSPSYCKDNDWRDKYDDLTCKTTAELGLLRNEIYARHGLVFKTKELKEYFAGQSWYKPDPRFKEDMLAEDDKELIRRIKASENANDNTCGLARPAEAKKILIDIDGDGKEDLIESHKINDTYVLSVNGNMVREIELIDDSAFDVIDIDKNDKYKEISVVLGLHGNHGMYLSKTLFQFSDNKLVNIGVVPGEDKLFTNTRNPFFDGTQYSVPEIKADGSGVLERTFKANLLLNEMRSPRYKLSGDGKLEEIPVIDGKYPVSINVQLKNPLAVNFFPAKDSASFVMAPDSRAKLIMTDNKEWCEIENSKGRKGWFAVNKYHYIRGSGLSAAETFDGLYDAKKEDLDGDGKQETMHIIPRYLSDDSNGYILVVNNAELIVNGVWWGPIILVDIDKNDGIKEICAQYYRGSEFFYYNGTGFVSMGNYDISPKAINGSGIIEEFNRSTAYPGLGFKQKFKLNAFHKIERIEQEFYEMNSAFRLSSKLELQKMPNEPSHSDMVMMPGENVKFILTDNKQWFQVQNEKGEKGWFSVGSDYKMASTSEYMSSVFKGLTIGE